MDKTITITKKKSRKGDDGYKIVSVRMREELVDKLDSLSLETGRSRNELINLLLNEAIDIAIVKEY